MEVEARRPSEVGWVPDDWLTKRLETPCLRIAQKVDERDLPIAVPAAPGFYSIKVPAANDGVVRCLYERKFRLVDTHVSQRFEGDLADPGFENFCESKIGLAELHHIPALQAIAVECFCNSRFHRDSGIASGRADQVWRQWINDAVEDRDRHVLIAQRDGQICGFISLRPAAGGFVSIDLMAVAPRFQRARIGELLVRGVFAHGAKPSGIVCETEAWNMPALNLYGRLGFASGALLSIFHFHKVAPQ